MYSDLSKRFAYATGGCTYNTTSDFPTTGSGFGVNTQALTLYAGFVIPEYSRICFMNYGGSPDAAISAVAQSGDIYSAFRNGGIWQNGKISASKDDFKYIDVRAAASANKSIVITDAPTDGEYIPLIISHATTNDCQDTIVCDNGKWRICSTVSQEVSIRFYHMPIS